jgi:hypothetical protein
MQLCNDFSMGEISDVNFQIGKIKAPGRDGFYSRFIKEVENITWQSNPSGWTFLRQENIA